MSPILLIGYQLTLVSYPKHNHLPITTSCSSFTLFNCPVTSISSSSSGGGGGGVSCSVMSDPLQPH